MPLKPLPKKPQPQPTGRGDQFKGKERRYLVQELKNIARERAALDERKAVIEAELDSRNEQDALTPYNHLLDLMEKMPPEVAEELKSRLAASNRVHGTASVRLPDDPINKVKAEIEACDDPARKAELEEVLKALEP